MSEFGRFVHGVNGRQHRLALLTLTLTNNLLGDHSLSSLIFYSFNQNEGKTAGLTRSQRSAMAQAAADDPNTAPPTLEGSLGVVGPLRVRSYGNVKHAHVVLRKVDEVEYEDNSGRKRKRGVFSLFAHKIINVKAGKELFLYLHPVNGELQERSVALEGDLLSAEELTSSETTAKDSSLPLDVEDKVAAKSLERSEQKAVEKSVLKEAVKRVEDTESTDVEMKGVPTVQREQVLPPKMRKLWARKSMQALKANEPGAFFVFLLFF